MIKSFNDFVLEKTIIAGFGPSQSTGIYSLSNTTPSTGYDMTPVVAMVNDIGSKIMDYAYEYDMNDNPDHTAESYVNEAKKCISEKIDEMFKNRKDNKNG